MRTLKLILTYDGTDFSGWQRQIDRRTVQQELEEALGKLTDETITCHASGRTDAGVHALGQVVHFHTISKHKPEVFVRALNSLLPRDVRVLDARDMPQTFHATVDAKRKLYRYVIDNGPIADPFQLRHGWHVFDPLDSLAMHRAAQSLKGRHDFHSFETHWPNRMSSVRTITHISVNRMGRYLWVDVEADGFLYNMVRSIVGTLTYVGKGKWSESRVSQILEAEDRAKAGPTAPPQGLFLVRVAYSDNEEYPNL